LSKPGWRKTRYFFYRLWRLAPDRAVELGIAIFVMILILIQVWMAHSNNKSTTQQTQQLITAAGISAQAARDNVIASRNFAESARGINQGIGDAVDKLRAQAEATQEAANAADSAAGTAQESLHISQRAYLITGEVTFDPETGFAKMLYVNGGHIPARDIEVTAHVLAQTADPMSPEGYRWERKKLESLPANVPMSFSEGIPHFNSARFKAGQQKLILVGFFTYNDGFSDNLREKWSFCAETVWQTKLKMVLTMPCASNYLSKIESLDGYPEREGEDQP
jgi:hypothetical protein